MRKINKAKTKKFLESIKTDNFDIFEFLQTSLQETELHEFLSPSQRADLSDFYLEVATIHLIESENIKRAAAKDRLMKWLNTDYRRP